MKLHPLQFEPILKKKVWGGRKLASLGRNVPDESHIGESWEIADLASTDVEGGGGGEAHTLIAWGDMAGMTLREASRALGANLLGNCRLTADGGFPLLIKFLDARENLSVQVHPSEAFAAKHTESHVKTESWYVISADPGAVIYAGLTAPISKDELRKRAHDGSLPEVLRKIEVHPGDCFHLPSGTIHALGAGVMVAEVQTPSDTTFRLFDWGRSNRRLDVDKALQCALINHAPIEATRSNGSSRSRLVATDAYELFELRAQGGAEAPISMPGDRPLIWLCLDGDGSLESDSGAFPPIPFERGTTLLLPAAAEGARCVVDRSVRILEVRPTP